MQSVGIALSSCMSARRRNPDWGRPIPVAPAIATEFEITVKRLRLMPQMYTSSHELKRWCECNRNRAYIPEWLLTEWGIRVEIRYGQDAA